MLPKLSLQSRLLAAFLLLGLIVLFVGIVGWRGSNQLSRHINILGNNTLPSVTSLWKINEGQAQIQASEQALLNPLINVETRQRERSRIDQAWQQIDQGFSQYNATNPSLEEQAVYNQLLQSWQTWKNDHQQFLSLYSRWQQSPNDELFAQLNRLSLTQERASFERSTQDILNLIQFNEKIGAQAWQEANQSVATTQFWSSLGMIAGPILSILLGLFFSYMIAKPLGHKITGIVQNIVSSSSEIAASAEQQERNASQQAASVTQTTSTMDELSASSRTMAQQAQTAATTVQDTLKMTESGSQSLNQTLDGMIQVQAKVQAVQSQIESLLTKARAIGNISQLVSDIANQTNMLALNAAVEAVRAGEQGRGFSVVASEIRKLADQSKQSAQKIGELVTDVQSAIRLMVDAVQEGTQTVRESVDTAQGTTAALTGVTQTMQHIALNSQQISLTAKQQAIAIQQVVEAMNNLTVSAQETALGIRQTKTGIHRLNEAAVTLQAVV